MMDYTIRDNIERPEHAVAGIHNELRRLRILQPSQREWLAGMAMQGLLSADEAHGFNYDTYDICAKCAVLHADALLAELKQEARDV